MNRHVKLMRCSGDSFRHLTREVSDYGYSPKRKEGFIVNSSDKNTLRARYIHTNTSQVKSLHPTTFQEELVEVVTLRSALFHLDLQHGCAWTDQRRGDLNLLEEQFESFQYVRVQFEDLAVNLVAAFNEIRDCLGKVDLLAVRIKDFLSREGALATANFKLMEPQYEDEIVRKYGDEIQALVLRRVTTEGRIKVCLGKNGSIRCGDDLPMDEVEFITQVLMRHNEEVQLETVEI